MTGVKIVIIGYKGYVGNAAFNMVKNHYDTLTIDKTDKDFEDKKKQTKECKLSIIGVPTPENYDGSCNTEIVEDVVSWCDSELILIKSTIPPGTTDKLKEKYKKRIVFSPEVIGESKYHNEDTFLNDMTQTPFLILGGDEKDTRDILDLLVPILGPRKKYRQCKAKEAEMVKYMLNVFFSMKVTFANEMYEVCKALGIDYYNVRDMWGLDPRTDLMHTAVFEGNRGFGGKCLVGGTKLIDVYNNEIDIEDISIGDLIYDGVAYTPVTKIKERNIDKTIKITARGRDIEGSADHIHIIVKDKKLVEKELREIKIGDWIFMPSGRSDLIENRKIEIGNKKNNYIKWWLEEFKMDEQWARIFGLYLAEGCMSSEYSVIWSYGEKYEDLANETQEILKEKGLKSNKKLQITNGTYGESRCWVVRCRSAGLQELMKKIGLGSNSHSKNCYVLPNHLAEILIGGYLEGDGCYSGGTIEAHSESLELIRVLDRMFINLGINVQISNNKKRIKISRRHDVERVCEWVKRFKFDSTRYKRGNEYESPTLRRFGDGWAIKVTKLEEMDNKLVYSLETASHLYVANNILTHNCFPKDTNALIQFSKGAGYTPELIEQVIKSNNNFKTK